MSFLTLWKGAKSIMSSELARELRVHEGVEGSNAIVIVSLGHVFAFSVIAYEVGLEALIGVAAIPLGISLLLNITGLRAYWRVRNRALPNDISKRRMRTLVISSLMIGLSWSAFIIILLPLVDANSQMVIIIFSFIAGWACIGIPSPQVGLPFSFSIMLTTWIAMIWLDIFDWEVASLITAVSFIIIVAFNLQARIATIARIRLSLANVSMNESLERVSEQLAKYISPQLYQGITSGEQKVAIDSKRKKLTIFFSDIANFTEITEQLESEELTSLLNEYLTEMSKIAQKRGAYFDKFIGDAMMFYFGDPETKGIKEDAVACVLMAIEMQRRLRDLQTDWREKGLIDRPFEARIGINTGYCTVGNFGSEDRMDYTIIGGEVNLTARMEAHAEVGGILMTAETYSLVSGRIAGKEQQEVNMKGFPQPIRTFSVEGIYDEDYEESVQNDAERGYLNPSINYGQLSGSERDRAIVELKEAMVQLKA